MSRQKILHVMRAPVGGLFRHVQDVAREQTRLGHQVGIIADASTGGDRAEAIFASLDRDLAFGVMRVAMSRDLGWSDISAVQAIARKATQTQVDVLHGHGAKGGAYVRLAQLRHSVLRVYTPHGGSLHYSYTSATGCVYLSLEKILNRRTDLFLFESHYGKEVFLKKIGQPSGLVRVVHNGVGEDEFLPISSASSQTDLVFIGELRQIKGVDLLLHALAELRNQDINLTATIVGDGPDGHALRLLTQQLGLEAVVNFTGVLPARQAFSLGRILVMPSRAESLPYVVLEAAAAGRPLLASNVGGISEIFGNDKEALFAPDSVPALIAALKDARERAGDLEARTLRLQQRVREKFSSHVMVDSILKAYAEAMASL